MTHDNLGPGDVPDDFNWTAAEADLGDLPAADVLDLNQARTRRRGEPNPADTHYEVTLDDEATPGGIPVETPETDKAGRRPVIPSAWSGWPNVKASLRDTGMLTWYRVRFHGVRSPWYAAQALFWATWGLIRVLGAHIRWWWVSEQYTLRQAAADRQDDQAWYKLHREVKATRAWRGFVILCEVLLAGFAGPVLWTLAPGWVLVLGFAGAVALLARYGRPVDRPIVSAAVVASRLRRVNPDIILRAYYAAGLGHPDKPNQQVMFGSPMSRDNSGSGSQVTIDLPYGKTFDDVIKAKGAIASGLDVSINQVFITRDPSSHRRHVLFVADRDPLAIPAGKTPLLDCKVRDIWTEAPLGLDERGRKVSLLLMWISILIGAMPRKGKTFTTRALALFAALDPYVMLLVADGKMSADWEKFRLVAYRYVCGVVPNSRDNDPLTHFLEMLREIKKHIEQVNDFLAGLPTSECPEGKITRALSRKYPLLRVWLLVMEEFQNYFETDDQDVNKEIASLLSFIKAVGPSAGVIILSSSQKPSGVGAGDVSRLFNRYRDNHDVRFALKCGNDVVSRAILGGDAYAEGYDASALPTGRQYLGVGILYGHSDDTAVVRTYLADHTDAEKILVAARKHREAAGTLAGYAAGEKVARELRDSLADVRSVFLPGEPGLHWAVIAARLAEQLPEHYADATAEAVSALLREHVPSVVVKVKGEGARGCRLADIDDAIGRRKSA
ncbi:cell division protein FtsK [Actinoplanes sp. NPDC026619]|uniref:cell division protein FtsK n=1 Tax=Actinoplanes sp. NPDC026619 TaxID=3155798 RepID=UPI0033C8D9D3